MSGAALVSRGTRRRRSGVAQAWLAALAFLAAWVVTRGYVAALVAWPLLVPEFVVAALVAVDVTSPRPRLVRVNRKQVG